MMTRDYFIKLALLVIVIACVGCTKKTLSSHEAIVDPIEFRISQKGDRQMVAIKNLSTIPIATVLTHDNELVYNGEYAYDSLFCKTKKMRLSTISDFFFTRIDTIYPNESREYLTSLYRPIVSEMLDSTRIYSFSFNLLGENLSRYTRYVICARGEDGEHRMETAACELIDSAGKTVFFEFDEQLCGSNFLTKEEPF